LLILNHQRHASLKRASVPLFILTLGFAFAFRPFLLGQESGNKSTGPEPTVQSEERCHAPVFGKANEFVLTSGLEYHQPKPGFNRTSRDIDLQVAGIGVGAHLQPGGEFQFDGLVLRAQGYRTLPSVSQPADPSNAQGFAVGPLARWNFLQVSRFRPFVEAAGDVVLFTPRKQLTATSEVSVEKYGIPRIDCRSIQKRAKQSARFDPGGDTLWWYPPDGPGRALIRSASGSYLG